MKSWVRERACSENPTTLEGGIIAVECIAGEVLGPQNCFYRPAIEFYAAEALTMIAELRGDELIRGSHLDKYGSKVDEPLR